ncbi:DUF4389 domain-containing protein [Yinghuangia aomiensis]|uniref:DUF4389 domain-containing protein n=1 Tax=Yinghuangia aomiensis TaxID=676205 RepID=A0ABP9I2K7_9ACTN
MDTDHAGPAPTPARPRTPARLEGALAPDLSRWLWLVKWLLIIPHAIVLVFLWIGFLLATIVAFFAILFTERYPRALFDFNLGVMRWTWRVAFYSYNALGTDRYPPFSLREEPGYPAHLDVDYPEHLSRGLVLVKWWLLALPQYLIVVAFTSGFWKGPGLLAALVFIAGVALLFTRRYPLGLFAFAMGLNRWTLRVTAYAALMTDVYPPFRLDQGGAEPAD